VAAERILEISFCLSLHFLQLLLQREGVLHCEALSVVIEVNVGCFGIPCQALPPFFQIVII